MKLIGQRDNPCPIFASAGDEISVDLHGETVFCEPTKIDCEITTVEVWQVEEGDRSIEGFGASNGKYWKPGTIFVTLGVKE